MEVDEVAEKMHKMGRIVTVLQCLHCKAILGDTSTLRCLHRELRLVVLEKPTNYCVSSDPSQVTHHVDTSLSDYYCARQPVLCSECQSVVGRQYVTFRPEFTAQNDLKNAICYDMSCINTYDTQVEKVTPVQQAGASADAAPESIASLSARLNSAEADAVRIKHVSISTANAVTVLNNRLHIVENMLAHNGAQPGLWPGHTFMGTHPPPPPALPGEPAVQPPPAQLVPDVPAAEKEAVSAGPSARGTSFGGRGRGVRSGGRGIHTQRWTNPSAAMQDLIEPREPAEAMPRSVRSTRADAGATEGAHTVLLRGGKRQRRTEVDAEVDPSPTAAANPNRRQTRSISPSGGLRSPAGEAAGCTAPRTKVTRVGGNTPPPPAFSPVQADETPMPGASEAAPGPH